MTLDQLHGEPVTLALRKLFKGLPKCSKRGCKSKATHLQLYVVDMYATNAFKCDIHAEDAHWNTDDTVGESVQELPYAKALRTYNKIKEST